MYFSKYQNSTEKTYLEEYFYQNCKIYFGISQIFQKIIREEAPSAFVHDHNSKLNKLLTPLIHNVPKWSDTL